MALSSTKSIASLQAEASAEGSHTLKRALSATNLTLLGIGAIIGAGIFVLTGNAAAQYAGPAVPLSFVIAGFGCLFAGLCYAEFSSMIPIAGSAYTYAYATMGEFVAWVIGWDLILEYLFGAATVAVGWSGYFGSLLKDFGITLSPAWTQAPYTWTAQNELVHNPGGIMNLPAVVLVFALTVLLVIGIKESANFNNLIVFLKVAIVFLVIGFGAMYVNPSNWHPFVPPNTTGKFGEFGYTGVLRAAAVVFFAYIGFDAVSTAAQEAKNPQKDVPVGILLSLGICTALYIAMSLVLTGLAHYTTLNVPHPVSAAIEAVGPALAWLGWIVDLGATLGLASVVLVMLLAQPRIFFSMSNDGLLPPMFSAVHPKFRTPWIPQILTGIVAAIVAGLLPVGLLGQLVSIGTLMAFVIVCGGIIVLRNRSPEMPRPFKTPWVPVVPILGIIFCAGLMFSLPPDTWIRLVIWMALGLIVYFAYSRSHSKLAKSGG